jgi:hypothetical protein
MSKKRKFRNRSFSMLEPDLIESEAIQGLSGNAVLVLIRFHQKAHRKKTRRRGINWTTITNNGQIQFPYAEAREFGIKSDRTFYRIIRQLVEDRGFIDIVEPGNWYLRQPTKFAISQRWKRYGTADFEIVEMSRSLPPGLGFQRGNPGRPQKQTSL